MATGVNPGDAAVVLKTLQDVWDLASERMLDTVARRLARGITTPGWAEQKAREVLALRGELAAVVSRLGEATPELVTAALDEAYQIGTGAAGVLDANHIRSRPEAVQRLATRLTANLQGAHLPVIRAHEDLFRRAVADSEVLMSTGTITRRDAVAQSVDRLLAQGQDRFKDAAGRRWHLDAYARMAGRTMAGQSMVQGQLDSMVERGRDLVVISDSPRECEHCRPWEGRLLSVTGASVGQEVDGRRVEGSVAEARGAGLWHPNCTHRADPYTPGLTRVKEPKSNPDGYEDQQKLRGYERTARDLKRRLAAAEKLGATDEARKLRAKVRDNSARIQAHTKATGQLRKRDRERPVGGNPSVPEPRRGDTPTPPKRLPVAEPRPAPKPAPRPAPTLADRARETPTDTRSFTDGLVGETELRTYADGTQVVRKVHGRTSAAFRDGEEMTDAEVLGASLLRQLDVAAPEVHKAGPREVYMEFMDGKVGWLAYQEGPPAALLATPGAKRLGLADYLLANTDRNPGNWLVRDGGDLVGIDHGAAWEQDGPPDMHDLSPFARWLFKTPGEVDINPEQLAEVQRRVEAMRPEFEALGRGDWLQQSLTRLAFIRDWAFGEGRLW